MFLENAQFGGYKLKSMIGKGGVAEVWLADQLALDREVAVKVISSELISGDDSDFIDRFKREAHSVARLDHPGILPVFDYGEADGYLYLVMPNASGGNLRTRVRRSMPSKEEIAAIFENITGGIGHAHSHGLIHRDLKPANILLNEDGRAFIADFGIAKTMDNNTNMTQAGIILGSPAYMAPEQFLGQADRRSDIYSMGLILFFLLTGRKLYNGRLPFEIGKRHLEEPIPLPDSQVPVEYESFLYRALAKNPDERFQTAAEMLKAFRQIPRQRSAPVSYYSGGISSSLGPSPVPNPAPTRPRPTPPVEPAAQWIEEKRGGPPVQPIQGQGEPPTQNAQPVVRREPPPANPEAAWMQEKRGATGGPELSPQADDLLYNSFGEIKAPLPKPPPPVPPRPNANPSGQPNNQGPVPGEAAWMREKQGDYMAPPEGTMWREFDPSLNSFGELKQHLDQPSAPPRPQSQPRNAPAQPPQPAYDPNNWSLEPPGGQNPAQNRQPDAAYERYSQEKGAPGNQFQGQPQNQFQGQPGGQPQNYRQPNGQGQPQNYRQPNGQQQGQPNEAQWMAEKRGQAPGQNAPQPQNQQAQWMREKTAVPGNQSQGQPDQSAQWMREKTAIPGQPQGQPGGQPQTGVKKLPRKQPIWLFAIIGVLVLGIIAVVAVILISGGKGPTTTTPTALAGVSTTPGAGTTGTTSGTTSGTTTQAVTGGATTAASVTTASATTAPATTFAGTSVASGTEAIPLTGHAGPINMVSWSSNGKSFLTASDDKTIKIWDAATNKVTKTLNDAAKPITDRVIAAVFSPDGQFVVATLADQTVNVYSVNAGNVVAQVKGDHAVPAAIAPDSSLVVYAGSRTIHSFDLKKNAAGPEFPFFDPSVNGLTPTALAFAQDNSALAVGLSNGRIIIYTASSGQPIMQLDPPDSDKTGVRQLTWYTGATRLAVGRDASLQTLSVDLGKKVATNTPANGSLNGPTTSLSVSADGKRLAISSKAGELQLWSLESNAILTRSTIGANPVIGLHWSSDDKKVTIATGGSSPALNTVEAQKV